MKKMHLSAAPANEGARRLVWWINTQSTEAAYSRLSRLAQADRGKIERLVAGELVPGGEMGHLIMLATDGAVPLRHWRQRPHGGWFDRPQGFQEQEARGVNTPGLARVGGANAPFASPAPVQQVYA